MKPTEVKNKLFYSWIREQEGTNTEIKTKGKEMLA